MREFAEMEWVIPVAKNLHRQRWSCVIVRLRSFPILKKQSNVPFWYQETKTHLLFHCLSGAGSLFLVVLRCVSFQTALHIWINGMHIVAGMLYLLYVCSTYPVALTCSNAFILLRYECIGTCEVGFHHTIRSLGTLKLFACHPFRSLVALLLLFSVNLHLTAPMLDQLFEWNPVLSMLHFLYFLRKHFICFGFIAASWIPSLNLAVSSLPLIISTVPLPDSMEGLIELLLTLVEFDSLPAV